MERCDIEGPSIALVLTEEELAIVKKSVNGQGGFQTLFNGLKAHVADRILTITPELSSIIVRYSEVEGQGGYQDRLKRLPRVVEAARRLEQSGDYMPGLMSIPEAELSAEEEVKIDDNLEEDFGEPSPFRYSITSYGADYTIDGLVKRISQGDIYLPTFQRGFVWKHKQASRFLESLLLGLPVPGIFLSKESDSNKLLVIDGQQRLKSLEYFYKGVFGTSDRVFSLKGVDSRFEGSTYASLSGDDRRQLDDSILHATIVKQDEPSEDNSSIYHIFERLNTGGTPLCAQEIRACVYHGDLVDLLKEINYVPSWRSIFGPVDARMRDQELIVRFLALYFYSQDYKRPMKGFINRYMFTNRRLQRQSAEQIKTAFEPTIFTAYDCFGKNAFRRFRVLNAAIFDAVMVGLAHRLSNGPIQQSDGLLESYNRLLIDSDFMAASQTATGDEKNVLNRVKLAIEAFSKLI